MAAPSEERGIMLVLFYGVLWHAFVCTCTEMDSFVWSFHVDALLLSLVMLHKAFTGMVLMLIGISATIPHGALC